jgi:hypothetical protein
VARRSDPRSAPDPVGVRPPVRRTQHRPPCASGYADAHGERREGSS